MKSGMEAGPAELNGGSHSVERLLGNLSSLIKKYDEQKADCRKYWRENIEGRRVEETYAEGRWHYQMEEEAEETLAHLLDVAREISLLPNNEIGGHPKLSIK